MLNNKLRAALLDNNANKLTPLTPDPGEGVTEADHIDAEWHHLWEVIYNSSITVLGRKEYKSADWFEAHWEKLDPVIEAKRKALIAYKASPSPATLQQFRIARNTARRTARFCANTYWTDLCRSIQMAADMGNTKELYEGIKRALCPRISKSAPIKSKNGEIITERDKPMQRWT